MTTQASARPVDGAQSIRRALAVLRLLAAGQELGVRLTDLAATSGLRRPTLHRILRVLVEEQAVEQDPETRCYRIGQDLTLLGLARKSRFPLRSLARPGLDLLCREIGDTVFLSVRTGLDSICIDRAVGSWPLQVLALEIGARRPLGVGVSGVAMLAAMPPAEASRIIEANAVRLDRYALDGAVLADAVRLARERGYAYAPNGIVRSTRAVAAAVLDGGGHPVAAISVAGMANRLTAARLPSIITLLRRQTRTMAETLAERGAKRATRAASSTRRNGRRQPHPD
ncbi:MAG: IclR family transcriptional regulator [Burkholderiaceae bacterium]|nr:IclR family transcriptional regulator [Burkholderiaceae bacterium]